MFLGLALSSLWLVGLGAAAGRIGGANDPTAMILGAGLPISALLLMALSTITTNFVNLYLSALAVRNLWHRAPPRPTVLVVGAIGTLFGLLSPNLLDRYAAFMGWIGTGFLPIAAITVVHFFVLHRGADGRAAAVVRSPRSSPGRPGSPATRRSLRFAPQRRRDRADVGRHRGLLTGCRSSGGIDRPHRASTDRTAATRPTARKLPISAPSLRIASAP